ncbi:MAG: membrane protein insertion efficiency factor YidD [Gammaproteobacteria bacterium]
MSKCGRYLARLLSRCIIGLVQCYRLGISPMLPPRCRHLPTCSEYCIEAVQQHGPMSGSWLGLKRAFRCHPWGTSGLDPVPPAATGDESIDVI